VHAAFGCHSARDYKGLIAGAELFVGERMHACIAALSQNVPCVVIGYSVKARGIMDDIFGAEADRLKLTVPVEDFVNVGTFTQVLDGVWQNRADIRGLLQGSIPKIQARARKNFELLSSLSLPNARRANGA
jgi:polysaccharide pyruvyl transferase WcaK-like protein